MQYADFDSLNCIMKLIMSDLDSMKSKADREFLREFDEIHDLKLVNQRHFSDEELEVFETARKNVVSVLEKMDLPEAALRVKDFKASESAFICDGITYRQETEKIAGLHYGNSLYFGS